MHYGSVVIWNTEVSEPVLDCEISDPFGLYGFVVNIDVFISVYAVLLMP